MCRSNLRNQINYRNYFKIKRGSLSCHSGLDPESSLALQLKKNLDSHFHGNDKRLQNKMDIKTKNKKVFLMAYIIGFFLMAGFLLAYGAHNAVAAGCVGTEVCKSVTLTDNDTKFIEPAGFNCTSRGNCPNEPNYQVCCKADPAVTAPSSVTTAVVATPAQAPTTTNSCNSNNPTEFCNPLVFGNVEGLLGGLLSAIQKIIVVLALVFITIGAMMILTSAGNSGMVEQGKGAITMALVGLALGVAAPSLLKELANIIGWGGAGAVAGALTLSEIAIRVLNFLLGIAGILALVMLVIGAILYLTSAGDEDRASKGKDIFKFSLIGLVLAMSSMILVTQISKFFITTPVNQTTTTTNNTSNGTFVAPATCPVGDFSCIGGSAFGSVTQENCTSYQAGSVVNTNGTNCCSSNDYACLGT
jgi:hypothetical protein